MEFWEEGEEWACSLCAKEPFLCESLADFLDSGPSFAALVRREPDVAFLYASKGGTPNKKGLSLAVAQILGFNPKYRYFWDEVTTETCPARGLDLYAGMLVGGSPPKESAGFWSGEPIGAPVPGVKARKRTLNKASSTGRWAHLRLSTQEYLQKRLATLPHIKVLVVDSKPQQNVKWMEAVESAVERLTVIKLPPGTSVLMLADMAGAHYKWRNLVQVSAVNLLVFNVATAPCFPAWCSLIVCAHH